MDVDRRRVNGLDAPREHRNERLREVPAPIERVARQCLNPLGGRARLGLHGCPRFLYMSNVDALRILRQGGQRFDAVAGTQPQAGHPFDCVL